MIRVLFFILLLTAAGLGLTWFLDRPGIVAVTWQGYRAETSLAVAAGLVILFAVAFSIAWSAIAFAFRIPSVVVYAARARRRARGLAALSRGFIAAGAGHARAARRAAAEAQRAVPEEPLALLLRAQAAQIDGDGAAAQAAFHDMAAREDTRLLGLRGLFVEATRRGDAAAARRHAHEAHRLQPLPWSAQAVLDARTAEADWRGALRVLNETIAAKLVDAETGRRQRAVLTTAIAQDVETTAPDEALQLAREALKGAHDLVPAATLAARLLVRRGDLRKAAKLVERTWLRADHPDLARAYVNLRQGDSNVDRLARAQTLFRLNRDSDEARLAVVEAALATRDVALARATLAPLLDDTRRPRVRTCLLVAEIEEAEHGTTGVVREWLARASRAPRDPAWMADGIVYDTWLPVSPTTGAIDAMRWQQPPERLRPPLDASAAPAAAALPAAPDPAPGDNLPPAASVVDRAAPEAPAPVLEPVAAVEAPPPARGQIVFQNPSAPDDPGPETAEQVSPSRHALP